MKKWADEKVIKWLHWYNCLLGIVLVLVYIILTICGADPYWK